MPTIMAWPVPPGISLDEAYGDIAKKITHRSWNKFARSGLRLCQSDMDEIQNDYRGDAAEQKYRMCRRWQEQAGADASVEYIYGILNHFLFPKDCPRPVPNREHAATSKKYENEHGEPVKEGSNYCKNRSESQLVNIDLGEYCSKIDRIDILPCTREFFNINTKLESNYKSTNKKGNVVIINNTFSQHQQGHRVGCDVDVKNMGDLWKHLGAKVTVHTDLWANDIKSVLKNFSDESDQFDYCSIVIMSHGGQDYIYGNDVKKVTVKDLLDMFNNRNSPQLQGIPKLFFFQCCRGVNPDRGVEVADGPRSVLEDLNITPSRALPDSQVLAPNAKAENPVDQADAGPMIEKLPTTSDMLIAYATQLGDQAFRHTTNGSWFINAITNVFMRNAHNEHVLDLMVKVNQAVAEKSDSEGMNKAMSHIEFNLRKKLYFFPGS